MPETEPESEIEARRTVLLDAVREAGSCAMGFFRGDYEQWEKAENDPVSEADIAVDQLLRKRLLGAMPDDGWLSEESTIAMEKGTSSFIWVVDPIDGTRAFIKHKPQFTICAALVQDGITRLGAVFNPATDEFFEAFQGGGARRNGETIQVGTHPEIENCRMISSRDMFAPKHWKRPWPPIDISMVNSIAYRMALVASGDYDACINLRPQNDWDIVAAALIVKEAGGICSNRDGEPYTFQGEEGDNQNVVVANPGLHGQLIEKLKDFDPQFPRQKK